MKVNELYLALTVSFLFIILCVSAYNRHDIQALRLDTKTLSEQYNELNDTVCNMQIEYAVKQIDFVDGKLKELTHINTCYNIKTACDQVYKSFYEDIESIVNCKTYGAYPKIICHHIEDNVFIDSGYVIKIDTGDKQIEKYYCAYRAMINDTEIISCIKNMN